MARTAAAVLRADPVPPGELAITGPQALTAEALVNSINIIFGASIDLVPVSEEALALHLQVSGFPKSTRARGADHRRGVQTRAGAVLRRCHRAE
ncbi:hypothetical protein ACPA9J_03400 [Pseudomonas aeruginosa]